MDVRQFLKSAPYDEIVNTLAQLSESPDPSSINQLREFLKHRDPFTFTKFLTPRIVCLALVQKGPRGVRALVQTFPSAPGAAYPRSIVEALWFASERRIPSFSMPSIAKLPPFLTSPINEETAIAARNALNELVASALENESCFSAIIDFVNQERNSLPSAQDGKQFRTRVFETFTKGKIRITETLILQFEALLNGEEREEDYQRFLAEHPVFLDPMASRVIAKQRLGSELIADFVIRRFDAKYVIVEIEKPHDRIFTNNDDFSAHFTHALGQVFDFQQWVDLHGEYARSLMPDISSPRGLLIMGRNADLSQTQRLKLHRFNMNSSTVQALTFEEVAANARRLYQNIFNS
jgi:hypothetical protein